MAQTSFPIVGSDLTNDMWRTIMSAIGSGVLDHGGYPYRLSGQSNSANTLQIFPETARPAEAIMSGFVHRLTEAETLSVPGVDGQTTYTIACQYDPARQAAAGGPIRLGVFAGSLDRSDGKTYLIHYTGVRKPNQLLTDVQWTQKKQRVIQFTHVASRDNLPPVEDGLLYAAMCWVNDEGTLWQLHGTTGEGLKWECISDPEWIETPSTAFPWLGGNNAKPAVRMVGTRGEARGKVKRKDGSNFVPNPDGYAIMTIPAGYEPSYDFTSAVGSTSLAGNGAAGFARLGIGKGGRQIRAYPSKETAWIGVDGFTWFREG